MMPTLHGLKMACSICDISCGCQNIVMYTFSDVCYLVDAIDSRPGVHIYIPAEPSRS